MTHGNTLVRGAVAVLVILLFATGCALRQPEQNMAVYDLGLPPVQAVHLHGVVRHQSPQVLLVPTLQASRALQQTDMFYRLDYHDALQLKPYAQARWRSPPVELIDQRVRQQLGVNWNVVQPQTQLHLTPDVRTVHIHIDELSHVFDTPQQSSAWLQARVTVTAPHHTGSRLMGQRTFTVRQPSATPDAAGGAHGLRAAVHGFAQELDAWLLSLSTP